MNYRNLIGAAELIGDDELADLLEMISGDDDDDDMIGDVELIGDDDDDEIGRRRRRRRAGRRARRGRGAARASAALASPAMAPRLATAMQAAAAQRQGVQAVDDPGIRARRIIAGNRIVIDTTDPTFQIVVRAQEAYRPDRLILNAVQRVAGPPVSNVPLDPSQILITDISVGTKRQLAALGDFDASLFSRDFFSNGSNLDLDTVQPGTDLTIRGSVLPTVSVAPTDPVTVTLSTQGRALR